ncbi:MAG TPA: PilT/PilU family type 4a pilus ATPase [Planctomycetota bacterium]|nr:PilT/PilU family type 4a pilus ATPase [Planctomycetota bacterium]
MGQGHTLDDKLYTDEKGRKLSMRDLLETFSRFGAMRVSDLHLKVKCAPAYRVDGDLKSFGGVPLDAATVEALAGTLLTEEEMESVGRNGSADGSLLEEDMQFRLNVFRDMDGLSVAIRALEQSPPPVDQIGFPNNAWRDIVTLQYGLVLVTGITGAGKSTTIASLINHIAATRACRVITLEDPIEYRLRSSASLISQREVGRDVPSYERGLRDALREDPDVIFVGEMRDREATSWTLTAAETGHLVFSTLHTRDVRGSITRILDMYPSQKQDEVANQLSLGLSHIISQKLIPREDGEGRVVAMEIANNSYALANMIRVGKVEQIYNVIQTQTKDLPAERMTTLERSLARLVREGVVSAKEAEKWANHPSSLLDELARDAARKEASR